MDIIGTIYTRVALDTEGNVIAAPVELPGWHVNTPTAVEGWEPYRIYPVTPLRTYAGHETVCYAFLNEAEFKALAIEAGLVQPTPVEPEVVL